MDIQKLLFVTKFDELRFDALQSLLPLQKAALHHVVFLNVIEREKVALRLRAAGAVQVEDLLSTFDPVGDHLDRDVLGGNGSTVIHSGMRSSAAVKPAARLNSRSNLSVSRPSTCRMMCGFLVPSVNWEPASTWSPSET